MLRRISGSYVRGLLQATLACIKRRDREGFHRLNEIYKAAKQA